jgi:hypothetical protein
MSMNINNFKVLNLTSGLVEINGRKTLTDLDNIKSQINFKNNVTEGVAIPGTPSTISSGNLSTTAHMNSSFIKINKNLDIESNDNINIFNKLRFIYYFGDTTAQNTICYGWAYNPNQELNTINFNVLFANCLSQTNGDYIDVDLPDDIFYPNLYLVIILFNDIWTNRIIEDTNNKICSIYPNQDFFCINPNKSDTSNYPGNDNNTSHAVVTKGFNNIDGINVRMVIGFEDHYIDITDKDYNDVVLVITDPINDDLNVNDNVLN